MIHKIKSRLWSNKLRLKIGDIVRHNNGFYGNLSGINSEPEMNSNSNWVYLGEVEKDGSFILRSGENLTEQEIIHLQEIIGIRNNLDIGFAADGTLNNGFDVPMEKVLNLVFNQLDFEYELDQENGVILIKRNSEIPSNFVPLPGTEFNNPISGNLQVAEGVSIFHQHNTGGFGSSLTWEDGGLYLAGFSPSGSYSFSFTQSGTFEIGSTATNSKGLQGTRYFGANYDDNTYIQKKYADDLFSNVASSDKLEDVMNRGNGTTKNIVFEPSQGIAGQIGFSKTTYSYYFGNMNPAHTGAYNVAMGYNALTKVTSGEGNTSYGFNTLANLTTGVQNTVLGTTAGLATTTGTYNTFVGSGTARSNTTGFKNTSIGTTAGVANTTGIGNTYIGFSSSPNNVSGNLNTTLGTYAGQGVTGSNNILIGVGSGANGGAMSNKLVIHNNTTLTGLGPTISENGTFGNINQGNLANALITGDFAGLWVKLNGTLSVAPSKLVNNDPTYTKNLVAKPDGTFGWEDRISAIEIYSTSEVKTNGIWVDGKNIYRKFVSITIPANADTSNPFSIPIAGSFEVISFEKCFMKIDGGARKIPPAIEVGSNNNWSYDIMNLNDLRVIMGTAAVLERVVSGVVEYTKPAL